MLSLVAFKPDHFETLMTWFESERDLVQWTGTGVRFPLDAAQLLEMIAENEAEPPAWLCWSALLGEEIVGHAQLALDRRNGNGLVARIALAPGHRGKGLARPLLEEVVGRGFDLAWLERLELNVYSFNAAAIRAYERAGFVREGVRRASARVGAERWDTVMMALLRSEWAGR